MELNLCGSSRLKWLSNDNTPYLRWCTFFLPKQGDTIWDGSSFIGRMIVLPGLGIQFAYNFDILHLEYLVVGGWANNRTLIRRRRQDYDMTTEYNFNILRKDTPLKLLIEISTGKCSSLSRQRKSYHFFFFSRGFSCSNMWFLFYAI